MNIDNIDNIHSDNTTNRTNRLIEDTANNANNANRDTTLLRYRAFAKAYIDNGFNATDAYAQSYKCANRESARRSASRLLTNVRVIACICEELRNVDLKVDKKFIQTRLLDLVFNAKRDSDKLGALKLLAQLEALLKDTAAQNIAVFSDLDKKRLEEVARKRLEQS